MASVGSLLNDRQALERCGKVITMLREEQVDLRGIDNEVCLLYHYLLKQTMTRDMKNQKRREKRRLKKESEMQRQEELSMGDPFDEIDMIPE